MKRKYVDPALFHSILKTTALDLRGGDWPDARAYYDTSQVRSPYRGGFFQDNQLMGLGTVNSVLSGQQWLLAGGAALLGYFIARKVYG